MKLSGLMLGINKGGHVSSEQVLPHTEAYRALVPTANWILFSALQGNGRDELLQMLVDALPEGPRYYPADQVTDLYLRDIVAELIREQIMLQMRDEMPYGVAVQTDQYKERDKRRNLHQRQYFRRARQPQTHLDWRQRSAAAPNWVRRPPGNRSLSWKAKCFLICG